MRSITMAHAVPPAQLTLKLILRALLAVEAKMLQRTFQDTAPLAGHTLQSFPTAPARLAVTDSARQW